MGALPRLLQTSCEPSSKPRDVLAEFPEGRTEPITSAFEVLFETPKLGLGYSSLLAPSSLPSLFSFLPPTSFIKGSFKIVLFFLLFFIL